MNAAPAEGFADHGDLTLDLTDLLVALGEAAQSVSRGVVLLFDEIQFLQPQRNRPGGSCDDDTRRRKFPIRPRTGMAKPPALVGGGFRWWA